MNIVFFGSSKFGLPALEAISHTQDKLACIITQPDKKKGRGMALSLTPVKSWAKEHGIKVYQPKNINDPAAAEFLKGFKADLFVVIAYGQILSQDILDIPKIFALNLHASLLPRWRGAAPINWAIIRGEDTTGVTVIKMTKEMDAGPIILQKEVELGPQDSSLTLEDNLAAEGAGLLIQALEMIRGGTYKMFPQDEKGMSLAPKLKKEDGLIDWGKPAKDISNLIRGCLAWPGAYTYYKGKLLKIYKAKASPAESLFPGASGGQIIEVSKEGIAVASGKDNLIIEELQIEGKRRMGAQEFIAGHKINVGEILGAKA